MMSNLCLPWDYVNGEIERKDILENDRMRGGSVKQVYSCKK